MSPSARDLLRENYRYWLIIGLYHHTQRLPLVKCIPGDRETHHHCAVRFVTGSNFRLRYQRGKRMLLKGRKGLEITIKVCPSAGFITKLATVSLERGFDGVNPERLFTGIAQVDIDGHEHGVLIGNFHCCDVFE